MARRLSLFILLLAVVFAAGTLLRAQQPATVYQPPQQETSEAPPPSYDTPPAITIVDGTARLLRQGQSQAAVANMPLIEGDRLATDSGRLGITFPDGSVLHLDQNTTVDFLSLSLMRLLDGRVILVAAGRGGERPSVDYQVDAPAGSVRVQAAGEYRISTYSREVELDVVSGSAAFATDQGSVQVQAGERSFARENAAPDAPVAFNTARYDAFDQWSDQQRNAETGAQSTEYLPSDLDAYAGTFDRDGRWENVQPYGYVWYPRVSVGWRPYYNGYWDNVGPYGWTWIGYERWAWPTHHWGRWGFRAGLWFWIPARRWAPAWVSWAYSPSYVSWCPLDFYNRPLVSLFFGFGHRSAFYDPWLCWTVLPRHRFGIGVRVPHYAVAGVHLGDRARNEFVMRRTGPDIPYGARERVAAAGTGGARPMPRALTSVPMQARPRDTAFATPRAASPGAAGYVSPRRDARSLAYSSGAASPRNDRPGALARPGTASGSFGNAAGPRASARPGGAYENRPPSSGALRAPAGTDRPAAVPRQGTPERYGAPRPYGSPRSSAPASPRYSAPASPRYSAPAAPRYSAPPRSTAPNDRPAARPRGDVYSAPRSYSPAPGRAQSYAAPRYSAPPRSESYAPRYSAPAAPRYSAPAAPRYSAPPSPRYSAPASPRYSAPASPRYSAPSYSAPRSMPAPRASSPSAGARSSGGGRPAPSGPSGGSARPRGGRQ